MRRQVSEIKYNPIFKKVVTEVGTKHGFMLINEVREYFLEVSRK
jgi:hypothetical protein